MVVALCELLSALTCKVESGRARSNQRNDFRGI